MNHISYQFRAYQELKYRKVIHAAA